MTLTILHLIALAIVVGGVVAIVERVLIHFERRALARQRIQSPTRVTLPISRGPREHKRIPKLRALAGRRKTPTNTEDDGMNHVDPYQSAGTSPPTT